MLLLALSILAAMTALFVVCAFRLASTDDDTADQIARQIANATKRRRQ